MPDVLPYVPDAYLPVHGDGFVLYLADDEDPSHAGRLAQAAADARDRVMGLLRWTPRRHLHICCYATTSQARQFLDRPIPSDMAMAPFCDEVSSLIVVQSVRCNARNGDPDRMLCLLAHELTHAFAAEKTGSTKHLGDGQIGMKLSSWLNEGLAEVVSLLSTGSLERAQHAEHVFRTEHEHPSFGTLSHRLDSLDDPLRGDAFGTVTGAVSLLCSCLTPAGLFDRLEQVDASCSAGTLCTARHLDGVVAGIHSSPEGGARSS